MQAERSKQAAEVAAKADLFWSATEDRALGHVGTGVGARRPVGHLRHLLRVYGSAQRPEAPECAQGAGATAVSYTTVRVAERAGEADGGIDEQTARGETQGEDTRTLRQALKGGRVLMHLH